MNKSYLVSDPDLTLTNSEWVALMYEGTREGKLLINEFRGDDFTDDDVLLCHMSWTERDRDNISYQIEHICNSLRKLAMGTGKIDDELRGIWETYVRPLDESDADTAEYNAICEKLLDDEELSEEEEALFNHHSDYLFIEAEHRVGKTICAYDVVIRACRLYRLIKINAPEIVISNESRLFATAMVLNRFASEIDA